MRKCNEIVKKYAARYNNVHLVFPDKFIFNSEEQLDYLHFKRIVIKRFCEKII